MAKRLLNKVSSESAPEFILPKMDSEAKSLLHTNVTPRSQSSSRTEQQSVESGKEEIGSSMQKTVSNLLSVEVVSGNINKGEATTTEFPFDLLSVEVASGNINKKDGNSTEFPEALCKTVHCAWQFCKFNGVFS